MAQLNLRSPLVAGVVMTLLAVVVGINLKTFVFKADDSLLTARPGRDPRPPADLATIVESVLNDGDLVSIAVASATHAAGDVTRDPFRFGDEPVVGSASTDEPVRTTGPLDCTAVIIDGRTPTALIGGSRYRAGDIVEGHRILDIDEHGVRIVDGDGRERLLSVQPRTNDTNFRITFNSVQDTPARHLDVTDGTEHERQNQ